jgi:predicted  nucleic acid-binding Zn-ribbon protein
VENAFDLLEERVRRAAEALRRLQADNGELKKQLVRAQGALQHSEKALEEALKAKASAEDASKAEGPNRELMTLRREREELRARLARLVEVLDGLE